MQVILDVSRLLACARRRTPSGIDRVELAYTRRWMEAPESACARAARVWTAPSPSPARPSHSTGSGEVVASRSLGLRLPALT